MKRSLLESPTEIAQALFDELSQLSSSLLGCCSVKKHNAPMMRWYFIFHFLELVMAAITAAWCAHGSTLASWLDRGSYLCKLWVTSCSLQDAGYSELHKGLSRQELAPRVDVWVTGSLLPRGREQAGQVRSLSDTGCRLAPRTDPGPPSPERHPVDPMSDNVCRAQICFVGAIVMFCLLMLSVHAAMNVIPLKVGFTKKEMFPPAVEPGCPIKAIVC
jgi:hypothetical protein